MRLKTIIAYATPLLISGTAPAAGLSHHGGIILDCKPPLFFDESPANDATVAVFDRFTFTASEDTDPATVHVWVDGKPVTPTITPQRSGRLTIESQTAPPIGNDGARVRILVSGFSKDGCERTHAYYVHVKPKA